MRPWRDVTRAVTELAELALDHACQATHRDDLDSRHGAPLSGPQGQPVQLWIIGMGKLGARELNVSSDIDLIYVYEHGRRDRRQRAPGATASPTTNTLPRAVKAIYSLVGDTTEHGFVFRVDLALRPNGNSGPAAVSLARAGRILAGARAANGSALRGSRAGSWPRAPLHRQPRRARLCAAWCCRSCSAATWTTACSNRCAACTARSATTPAKRSAGHPERANDVKLSRGGIREIEFTVQLLQVVRGGQFPELRRRPTLDALQRLAQAGPDARRPLPTRWPRPTCFLRQVEHRIQYLDDQQTHMLPTRDDDLAWIATPWATPTQRPF